MWSKSAGVDCDLVRLEVRGSSETRTEGDLSEHQTQLDGQQECFDVVFPVRLVRGLSDLGIHSGERGLLRRLPANLWGDPKAIASISSLNSVAIAAS
jgi:hypothetical protein